MPVTRNHAINEGRKRSYLTLVRKGERSKAGKKRNLTFPRTLKTPKMPSAEMRLGLQLELQLQLKPHGANNPSRGGPKRGRLPMPILITLWK